MDSSLTDSRSGHRLLTIAGIVAVFALAFSAPTWLNTLADWIEGGSTASLNYCSLNQQTCHYQGYQASLSDPTVHPMHANTLTFTTSQPLNSKTLLVKLKGVEMNMGEYRLVLNQIDETHYRGDLMLPVCTEQTMTWAGTITVPDQGQTQFPIKVTMERP